MKLRRRLRRLAVRYEKFMRWVVDPQDADEIEFRAMAP